MLLQKKSRISELRDSGKGTDEKKTKVHAQRKFAQGCPNFTIIREKENGPSVCQTNNTATAANSDIGADTTLEDCPKTEDFLTFLCFRSCPDILPESLKFFSDPLKNNFPNGVPALEKSSTVNNVPFKQENTNKTEAKMIELKKWKKDSSQVKKVPVVKKPKLGVGHIHSSFRRGVNSGIMTRMGRLKSSDIPSLKTAKKQASRGKKAVKKVSPVSVRVSTRSQLRKTQTEPDLNESSSDSESSDSDPSEKNHETSSPRKAKPRVLPKKSKVTVKKLSKCRTIHRKRPNLTRNSPVSKNTRQSAAKYSHEMLTTSGKKTHRIEKEATPTLRRKSVLSDSKETLGKKSLKNSNSSSDSSKLPKKITREATKKNVKNTLSNVAALPSRRPSRRTKEAATFFMTLIGQEEEFYSSELEEKPSKNSKKEDNQPPKKRIRVSNGHKPEKSSSSPPIRTRRSGLNAELPTSPAKRRATILQEAAKRFTETESSSSESSTEEEMDSSSSSSEDEVPMRSIRTRSFDPSQISQTKSPSNTCKRAVDVRATRSNFRKSKTIEKTPTKELKSPTRIESKKTSKPVSDKEDTKKRPNTKRTVSTPPLSYDSSSLLEAPIFYPNEKEFNDPIEYLEKIRPECERFGICRIVPPSSFKPECQVSDAMRFTAYNQYIHRMFRRRGPNSRILEAIHRHLRALDIDYQPAPCIGSIEVDLPGLYEAVQDLGGPGHVLENNLWSKVADMLKIPRTAQDRFSKLDAIYCKYLLPYATLSDDERQKLLQKVDSLQNRRPVDDGDEDECIVKGTSIPLSTFYRIARNTQAIWFPTSNSSTSSDASSVDPAQVEATYWQLVTRRTSHVCVHSGNIDSGQAGYGFPCNKTSRHPWNLKVLTNNNGSVLRSLGPVVGCTAPTLHVSMLFSASCWYRDPHGLPWIDYLHTGADKIWYGVSSIQEPILHQAMAKLVPDLVKGDKTVWLSSDTVMVPPTMLANEGVNLSRTVQKSGQFVVVWPRAFTSSLSTGYSVSESVYFAPLDWLPIGDMCFKELRINHEPTVFSLHQLLWNIAHDTRSTVAVLKRVLPILQPGIDEEIQLRSDLRIFGVSRWEKLHRQTEANHRSDAKKKRQPSSKDEGEMECEICQASLFFSRAEYLTHAESPVTWCLPHALQKIKDRPRVTQNVRIIYVHEENELRQTLQRIQDAIRTKSLRRTTTHQRSSTL